METNKGMNIHDDLNSNNEHISNILMKQFLKYYKSPYLVTDVYKKFILEGKVLYENTVLGMGYVGLSNAIMLSTKYDVICYDIDESKLESIEKKNHQLKIN